MPGNINMKDRSNIVALYNDGFNISEISRETGFTRNSVSRWIKRFEEEGSLRQRPRCGRPSLITPEQRQHMINEYKSNGFILTRKFADDFKISQKTVRRAFRAEVLKAKSSKSVNMTKPEAAEKNIVNSEPKVVSGNEASSSRDLLMVDRGYEAEVETQVADWSPDDDDGYQPSDDLAPKRLKKTAVPSIFAWQTTEEEKPDTEESLMVNLNETKNTYSRNQPTVFVEEQPCINVRSDELNKDPLESGSNDEVTSYNDQTPIKKDPTVEEYEDLNKFLLVEISEHEKMSTSNELTTTTNECEQLGVHQRAKTKTNKRRRIQTEEKTLKCRESTKNSVKRGRKETTSPEIETLASKKETISPGIETLSQRKETKSPEIKTSNHIKETISLRKFTTSPDIEKTFFSKAIIKSEIEELSPREDIISPEIDTLSLKEESIEIETLSIKKETECLEIELLDPEMTKQSENLGLCQCCLEEGDHNTADISNLLDCINVQVLAREFPALVCARCSEFLGQVRQFRDMVAASQRRLAASTPSTEQIDKLAPETEQIQRQTSHVKSEGENLTPTKEYYFDSSGNLMYYELEENGENRRDIYMPNNERQNVAAPSKQMQEVQSSINKRKRKRKKEKSDKESTEEYEKFDKMYSTYPYTIIEDYPSNLVTLLEFSTILPFKIHPEKPNIFHCLHCRESEHITFENFKQHMAIKHNRLNQSARRIRRRKLEYPNNVVRADISEIKCKVCKKHLANVDELGQHLVQIHSQVMHKGTPGIDYE